MTFEAPPIVFIASSSEGMPIAEALRELLSGDCDVRIWSEGVFDLSAHLLGSLVSMSREADFAVLVVSPDDLVVSRGESQMAPRDNIVFEAGLFMGALGTGRTFLLHEDSNELRLPSDLAGIQTAAFGTAASTAEPIERTLDTAASRIRSAIEANGIRESRLPSLLCGKWSYSVRGADHDYNHSGECEIDCLDGSLRIMGTRRTECENNEHKEVEVFWRSTWAQYCSDKMFKFDYSITLPTGPARGYVALSVNSSIDVLRGEFCYLAPATRFGSILLEREVDAPSRKLGPTRMNL